VIVKLPLDKVKKPCYTTVKFRKRGKIMKVFVISKSTIVESEEAIERYYNVKDEKARKEAEASKALRRVKSNNNNRREVNHG